MEECAITIVQNIYKKYYVNQTSHY